MKPYGYITLKEASEVSGVAIETLKKQCQTGRIRGAIKEGGTWFVPKDEIIIKPVRPGHSDDNALLLLVILTEAGGTGTNLTLYMNGLIIEGLLTSTKTYIDNMRKYTKPTLGFDDPETAKLLSNTMDTYFDNILKRNNEAGYEFVHMEQVTVVQGSGNYEPQGAFLRIRLDAIDGFQLGTIKNFNPKFDK